MKQRKNGQKRQYRHGDVLLVPVSELAAKKQLNGDKVVLAYGEVTGHSHTIDDPSRVTAYTGTDGTEVTELEVMEAVGLVHQEHDRIVIAPGKYQVYRPYEERLGLEGLRRVTD